MNLLPDPLTAMGLIASAHRVPIPGGPQDVAHVLDHALAQSPGREALVGRYARYTYRQLEQAVCAATAALRWLGVAPGDRVMASAANHPDLVIAFLATQRLGAIWVGVNRALAPAEKRHMVLDCGASVLLADRDVCAQIQALRAELPGLRHIVDLQAGETPSAWHDLLAQHANAPRFIGDIDPWGPAAIAYTSGTTGVPKGCVQSQHNMVLVGAAALAEGPETIQVRGSMLPLTILNMMILVALRAFQSAGRCVCMDRVDVLGVAQWVKAERIQQFPMPPTTLYDLLTHPDIRPEDVASMTVPGVGGGSLADSVRVLFRQRFGMEPMFTYGLTEAPTLVTSTDPTRPLVPHSSGTVTPQMQLRIADADDQPLPVGTVGEVQIGPHTSGPWAHVYTPMLGYWMRPEATAAALKGGWLHTGDHGHLDANGHLYIDGRVKDIIIRGGANVYPAEVERVIGADPRVAAVAVAGRPDERLGETVVAFVQPVPGAAGHAVLEAVREACITQLAKYKVPRDWVVVDDMPRNAMRKILKNDLVDRHFGKSAAA